MTGRARIGGAILFAVMLLVPSLAAAQSVSIDLGAGGSAGATSRLV